MADPYLPIPAGPQTYDVAPRRYWPVVTFTLLALNFVLFGIEIYAGGYGNLQVLLNLGAAFGPYMRRGEYWRLVMPIFLHGGWLHILGNNYALFILGPILERVYGYGRFALIYIAAGAGGAFLSMEASKNVSVGASGAIFGIAGAMLVTGYVHRDVIPRRWGRAFGTGIVPFILLNLVLGLSMHGIDNYGHLGGLATGAFLAFVIAPPRQDFSYGGVAESPSQGLVVLPLLAVALSMGATASHYRTMQSMDRLLEQGKRYEAAKQFGPEFQCFQQAAKLAPREERPHEELGAYYLGQEKYTQAIQEFQDAVRLTEGDEEARLELGLAYQMNGEPEKAHQLLEGALGNNPKTPQGQRLLAANHVMLADVYAKQKLYAEAVKSYQEALRLDPQMAVAHNNLAWLYATCDDQKYRNPKAALEHAKIAVDLTQWSEGGFIDTLAEAHFANGDYQQAVETQIKALIVEPDNKELQEHLERYRKAAGMRN